jgi:hypothetical protein
MTVTMRPAVDHETERAASTLRVAYRCGMCHKQCLTPCRFTGAEFRLLQQTVAQGGSPEDIERLVAQMGYQERS